MVIVSDEVIYPLLAAQDHSIDVGENEWDPGTSLSTVFTVFPLIIIQLYGLIHLFKFGHTRN